MKACGNKERRKIEHGDRGRRHEAIGEEGARRERRRRAAGGKKARSEKERRKRARGERGIRCMARREECRATSMLGDKMKKKEKGKARVQ
ncbi:hypothetical protein AMTR_s00097p00152750 [Amborella trichopoda]|uniref:Uncharacterized protein n=1 Tax=Amborella trichopoda TaxID=13333 RepID=W1P2H4_AMBTC|nr:hypothetical protein AMTR_s00097p00152750 [Amborella trichopoda]